jgi:dynamin 1-like protein
MDYINTSHPNFIGGTKAVEAAMHQVKSSRIPHPVARPKDTVEPDRTSSSTSQVKSRSFLGRQANGIVTDQVLSFYMLYIINSVYHCALWV